MSKKPESLKDLHLNSEEEVPSMHDSIKPNTDFLNQKMDGHPLSGSNGEIPAPKVYKNKIDKLQDFFDSF